MNIAITGASGFVGKVLTPLLLAQGHSLRLLTRQHDVKEQENIVFIHGDLLDEKSLSQLVTGADVVIHLAAMISMVDTVDTTAFRVNTTGTDLLLAAAQKAGARRFIYLSSIAAFEQAPYNEPMDESRDATATSSHNYDASKAIAQAAVLACNNSDFETIVLAPTAIAGPFDERPSLLGKAIINMYRGKLPALFPGGVDIVDVRDVAVAIVSALTTGEPGSTYLLSSEWISLKALNIQITAMGGKKKNLFVVPVWLAFAFLPLVSLWAKVTGGAAYYTRQSVCQLIRSNKKISHSKARETLNFKPRPFAETLKDEIDWFKKNNYLDH